MTPQEYSLYRDVTQWTLETAAKQPYLKFEKSGSMLTVDYTVWNSIEVLEKTAAMLHDDFKNLWKWVKKTHPFPTDYNAVKHSLVSLLFILKYNLTDELNRWKAQLQLNNGFFYTLPPVRPNWA